MVVDYRNNLYRKKFWAELIVSISRSRDSRTFWFGRILASFSKVYGAAPPLHPNPRVSTNETHPQPAPQPVHTESGDGILELLEVPLAAFRLGGPLGPVRRPTALCLLDDLDAIGGRRQDEAKSQCSAAAQHEGQGSGQVAADQEEAVRQDGAHAGAGRAKGHAQAHRAEQCECPGGAGAQGAECRDHGGCGDGGQGRGHSGPGRRSVEGRRGV